MKGSSGNTIIYRECQKIHLNRNGKVDGCQEYMDMGNYPDTCGNCGCLRGFHLPTVECKTKVVYTKCHKTHDYKFQTTVDGCQEFILGGEEGTVEALNCAVCGCHKGFHRNEITRE